MPALVSRVLALQFLHWHLPCSPLTSIHLPKRGAPMFPREGIVGYSFSTAKPDTFLKLETHTFLASPTPWTRAGRRGREHKGAGSVANTPRAPRDTRRPRVTPPCRYCPTCGGAVSL